MIRRIALFLSLAALAGSACAHVPLERWVAGVQSSAVPTPQPTNQPD